MEQLLENFQIFNRVFNGKIGNIQGIQFYECDNLTQAHF